MSTFRSIRNMPFFPVIPILPAALLVVSMATSIRALLRTRRLERRLAGG
ncbi:MAG TPA: hypothetical protein VGK52_18615 [Polyangia bacterium]|jgi:hypothetical protein